MAREDGPREGGDAGDAETEEADGEEWKFSLEDLEDLEDGEDEDGGGGRRLEPGSPNPENALFVALGMLIALFVIARAIGLV